MGDDTNKPLRIAAMISGGGRTVVNLQEKITAGDLRAVIEVVISSRADAPGVDRARACGLRTVVVDRRELDDEAFQLRLTEAVGGVDLVCLAGFLSLWHFPETMYGRVINIHPALLPEFGGPGMYGRRVHEAVLAAGRTESGCTVHVCDDVYDSGPIILQRRVPVLPDDTPDVLAARVFEQECVAYPAAIKLFCENRVVINGRRVTVLQKPRISERQGGDHN